MPLWFTSINCNSVTQAGNIPDSTLWRLTFIWIIRNSWSHTLQPTQSRPLDWQISYSCSLIVKLFRLKITLFRESYNKHKYQFKFTFMLLCIVIDFFLNNQPDAPIYLNLFCYKIIHVSNILSAHHQEFSTVHLALVSFMLVLLTISKQSQDGTALQFHSDSAWK